RGRAALGDRPHDERLPASGVTGHEHAGHVRLEVGVPGDVTPRVELQAELLDQTVVPVGAGEAHREGDQLGGDLALGPRPADRAAVDELDLAQVQPLHVAVRVALEVGGGDGVDPL